MAVRKDHLGIPPAVRKIRWKKALAFTCMTLCLVGVGVLGGIFAGDAHARNKASTSTSPCSAGQPAGNSGVYKELPAPNTDAAKGLLDNPNTSELIKNLYTFLRDPIIITEESTKAFLQQLQQQQGSSSSSGNTTVDYQTFITVAVDVLNYFRYMSSETLLPMLRQFSESGGTQLSMTGFDPDQVQSEIDNILQKTALDDYYTVVSQQCPHDFPRGNASTTSKAGRRLLRDHHHAHHHIRHLHQTLSSEDTSKPQTLKDMLCEVSSWSPNGMQSMSLNGQPLQCSASDRSHLPAPAPLNVVIPVVFHCLRFTDADGYLLPALTDGTGATPTDLGQNLIDVVNTFYEGTGIQFQLQEVRRDPAKYKYLLMNSLTDWQRCAIHGSSSDSGYDCLSAKSKHPDVAPLVEAHVINVFISGTNTSLYCKRGSSVYKLCRGTAYGMASLVLDAPGMGDWIPPTWEESASSGNWVWISHSRFSPAEQNSDRFWDAGAGTLAHELGHYLGLFHTFQTQESPSCDGDGLQYGDKVPDTPASSNARDGDKVWARVGSKPPMLELTTWCTSFRRGSQPDTNTLGSFDSCKAGEHVVGDNIDPVFNVMNYVPDQCRMTFTPNQVSRLQEMVTKYRPGMVARYTV